MTAQRLTDTTIRRHWEKARKVNAHGEQVTMDPAGPIAEAAWAKHRLSRATQTLPNGYCELPVVQSCPHANSCLTCPMFLTTAEFLPQHREQHRRPYRSSPRPRPAASVARRLLIHASTSSASQTLPCARSATGVGKSLRLVIW